MQHETDVSKISTTTLAPFFLSLIFFERISNFQQWNTKEENFYQFPASNTVKNSPHSGHVSGTLALLWVPNSKFINNFKKL
jgi:hypothetical protein